MPTLILAHPERLWWLLLLPVLLWLSLPPRPRRVVWTSHLAQWILAQHAVRRRPPRLLSLRTLLLLFAGTAAGFAAAGLALAGRPGPHRLVVLCDASASMAARDGGEASRLQRAKARMQAVFAALPPEVDVALLRCGGPLLRRYGASARAQQDLGEPAGALASDLVALARDVADVDTVVWTLTDGQGQRELPNAGALSVFGTAVPNAAVLAVRVTDRWPLPELDLEADIVVHRPGGGGATVRATASGAVDPVPAIDPVVEDGAITTVRFTCRRTADGGPLQVAVSLPGDGLADDDAWHALLPALPAPRIAVLAAADADTFATVAARALAAEVRGEVVPAGPGAAVALLLTDGGEVALAPGRQRVLAFGTRAPGVEARPWPEPRDLQWDRSSPLLTGLDLAELTVREALRGALPDGEVLVSADGPDGRAPLAVLCRGAEAVSLHFAFRLQDSNLALLPAFPQLLRRAFVAAYGQAAAVQVRTAPPPPGEQDLAQAPAADDRPLPPFGTPPRPLDLWLMAAGCLILVARVFTR